MKFFNMKWDFCKICYIKLEKPKIFFEIAEL